MSEWGKCPTCGGTDREGGSVIVAGPDEFGNYDADDCPDTYHSETEVSVERYDEALDVIDKYHRALQECKDNAWESGMVVEIVNKALGIRHIPGKAPGYPGLDVRDNVRTGRGTRYDERERGGPTSGVGFPE